MESVLKLEFDDIVGVEDRSSGSNSKIAEDSFDISIDDQAGTKQLIKAGHMLRVRAGPKSKRKITR